MMQYLKCRLWLSMCICLMSYLTTNGIAFIQGLLRASLYFLLNVTIMALDLKFCSHSHSCERLDTLSVDIRRTL